MCRQPAPCCHGHNSRTRSVRVPGRFRGQPGMLHGLRALQVCGEPRLNSQYIHSPGLENYFGAHRDKGRHGRHAVGSFSVQSSFAGPCLCHELAASAKEQEGIVCASWHKRVKLKGRKKGGEKGEKWHKLINFLNCTYKTKPSLGTQSFQVYSN